MTSSHREAGGDEFFVQVPFFISGIDHIDTINATIYELMMSPYRAWAFHPGAGMLRIEFEVIHVCDKLLSIHFFGYNALGGFRGVPVNRGITFDLTAGQITSLSSFFTKDELISIIGIDLLSERATVTNSSFNSSAMRIETLHNLQSNLLARLENGWLLPSTESFYITDRGVALIGEIDSVRHYFVVEIELDGTPQVR